MNKIVSQRLKKARLNKELTQVQVYKLTGINNKTLSGYENGISEPDLDTLKTLADLYGVSTEWLLGRTDDPQSNRQSKMPPDIRKIARAGQKMTPEQRKQWLKVGEALFPEAFKEEEQN